MSSAPLPPDLITLGRYLAGVFDNKEQAIADPTWYVPLHLWLRPMAVFLEDSITLFIEQANTLTPDQPYRQRVLRLQATPTGTLQGQFYALTDFTAWKGAGRDRNLLAQITPDHLEFLPTCLLSITIAGNGFAAALPTDSLCHFTYQGKTGHVSLGFQAYENEFLSYDKGMDPVTNQPLWGAIMGPLCFKKRQNFAHELSC